MAITGVGLRPTLIETHRTGRRRGEFYRAKLSRVRTSDGVGQGTQGRKPVLLEYACRSLQDRGLQIAPLLVSRTHAYVTSQGKRDFAGGIESSPETGLVLDFQGGSSCHRLPGRGARSESEGLGHGAEVR